MRINVAAKTDPGRLYDHNEDHFVLLRKAGLFLVADGVGGADAGELASQVACRLIQQSLHDGLPTLDKPRHDEALSKAIREANRALHDYARHHRDKTGVGTTITALWFLGDRVLFAYVGDSRIYLFRNGVLRQLSRDEKAGRYRLAASLGQSATVEPHLGMVRVRRGDRFLLCSDGLHGPVARDTMTAIIDGQPEPEACCQRLIDAANDAGGPDNITALVADVVEPDPPQPWRFSRLRLDATSPLARLRRAPVWAGVAAVVIAAVAVIAWAISRTPPASPDDAKVPSAVAFLAEEANREAAAGRQAAALRALQDLLRTAIDRRIAFQREDLGLSPQAAALYEQAAQTVWDKLYEPDGRRLDRLARSPEARYVADELRAIRERIDHIRQQFLADDLRFVADTFESLGEEVDAIALRGRSDLARDKEQLTQALDALRLDASEFEPGSDIRREVDVDLATAAQALEVDDIPTARSAVDAASAILRRALDAPPE